MQIVLQIANPMEVVTTEYSSSMSALLLSLCITDNMVHSLGALNFDM